MFSAPGNLKPILLFSAVLASSVWVSQATAQFYKCVDASGKVTFSDQGCAASEEAATVRVQPANTVESSRYQQAKPDYTQTYASPEPPRNQTRITVVGGNNDAERQRKKLCKEASTPHRGAHGLTAAQRAAAAQLCAGRSVSVPGYSSGSNSKPAPTPPPAGIASCDAGGCWDTNGLRYNQGAGSTYIPANGGHACQMIGGQMNCP